MVALSALLAIVLTGVQPSPAASPSPSSSPAPVLREIAHVRASELCSEFAVHANSAIDSATRNDIALGSLDNTLRMTDFDRDELSRRNGMDRLRTLADAITKDWKDGMREVGRLRDLEKKATDPNEKLELKDSADALGGALWHQRVLARDIDGFLAYQDARQMASNDETSGDMNQSLFGARDIHQAMLQGLPETRGARAAPTPFETVGLANDQHLPSVDSQALAAAGYYESQFPGIAHDEIGAAVHVENASEGC